MHDDFERFWVQGFSFQLDAEPWYEVKRKHFETFSEPNIHEMGSLSSHMYSALSPNKLSVEELSVPNSL